ncbi:MAG: 50S ribosomal protein L1 [Candidatus Midichloria sp.]|nr:MAG: 50S ribosomal protein L1 [Candidatus Midichloria sp.]
MAHNKRISGAKALVNQNKLYTLDEALNVLERYSKEFKSKFDETVEVVFKLGVDPRHSDQMVRGVIPMPHGLGKKVCVAVFAKNERHEEALKAGADIVGSEDLVDKVKGGKINFDICIATPDFMSKIAVLGKILGTKGLMPNPKLGTVSDNIVTAVTNAKSGQVEYKVEKAGLIHAGVGKLGFALAALKANIAVLYNAVLNAKPVGAKGVYMQKMYISTTHGPSIALDLRSMLV